MSRQIRPLTNSKNVELVIKNGLQQRFLFSDSVLLLDKVLINGIFISSLAERTPEYRLIPPFNNVSAGYLTLKGYDNQNYNERMPLNAFLYRSYGLAGLNYSNWIDILFIKPKLISIRNSFVEFPNIASWIIPAEGFGLSFTIFYEIFNPAIHQLNNMGELINDTNI